MATSSQASVIFKLSLAATLALPAGCAVTTHPTAPAKLGSVRSSAALEAVLDEPGPITVETVAAADWHVPLSGMVNLEHPVARAAGLEDHEEPIQIYLHALHHPTRGLFIIDSGVESALVRDRANAAVRGLVASVANVDSIRIKLDTRSWLERQREPLRGVFLTHLHLDHILGLPDVPRGTPLFSGPGEAEASAFMNVFVQGTTDRELAGHAPLQEWQFAGDSAGRFDGVLDIFGDGSAWALLVPGHTPGSTAYLVRTPERSVLFLGDACHTEWGWEHGVEPGTFSSDQPRSRESLQALEALVNRHPNIDVRYGHQPYDATVDATALRARRD